MFSVQKYTHSNDEGEHDSKQKRHRKHRKHKKHKKEKRHKENANHHDHKKDACDDKEIELNDFVHRPGTEQRKLGNVPKLYIHEGRHVRSAPCTTETHTSPRPQSPGSNDIDSDGQTRLKHLPSIERIVRPKVDMLDQDRMPSEESRIESHKALSHSRSFSELHNARIQSARQSMTSPRTPSPVSRGSSPVHRKRASSGGTLYRTHSDNKDNDDDNSRNVNDDADADETDSDDTDVIDAVQKPSRMGYNQSASARALPISRFLEEEEEAVYEYSYAYESIDDEEQAEIRRAVNLSKFESLEQKTPLSCTPTDKELDDNDREGDENGTKDNNDGYSNSEDEHTIVATRQKQFAQRPRSTSLAAITADYIKYRERDALKEEARIIREEQLKAEKAASIFGTQGTSGKQTRTVQARRKKHIPTFFITADQHGMVQEKHVMFLFDIPSFIDKYVEDVGLVWFKIRKLIHAIYKYNECRKLFIKQNYAPQVREERMNEECKFGVHILLTDAINTSVLRYLEEHSIKYEDILTWELYTAYEGYPSSTERTSIYAIHINDFDRRCGEPIFSKLEEQRNKYYLFCGDEKLTKKMFKTHKSRFQRHGIFVVHHPSVLITAIDSVMGELGA